MAFSPQEVLQQIFSSPTPETVDTSGIVAFLCPSVQRIATALREAIMELDGEGELNQTPDSEVENFSPAQRAHWDALTAESVKAQQAANLENKEAMRKCLRGLFVATQRMMHRADSINMQKSLIRVGRLPPVLSGKK